MDVGPLQKIATALAADMGWPAPRYVNAGASGAVFELQHPTHGQVALKIYDPRFFAGDNALIEEERLKLQRTLEGRDHPHLIRTIETAPVPDHGTWYLLMDFLPWPDLSEVIAEVPDARVAPLIAQLADAVTFLDALGLVHRDIKPANIGVSRNFSELKLLDLGVLRAIGLGEGAGTDQDGKARFVATAQYSPPEYLAREEPPGAVGFEALNVYQIGAVLHDMIVKRPLFADEADSLNKARLYRAVLNKEPEVFGAGVPARLNSLCRAALTKNPEARLAAVSVADFARGEDDVGQVRRRLAALRAAEERRAAPSTMQWRTTIRDWLADAALAERGTFGAFELPEMPDAAGWELRFAAIPVALPVRLVADDAAGVLRVVLGDPPAARVALDITERGPTVPPSLIVAQLQDQIMLALDEIAPGNSNGEVA
ncbi:protein kinase domain-containing protein [Sphingomonas sp.]|uniref:protein kinase domain-containing protein n=1 Tax=Sphingomonas sp. TaxID=28214 RepID=UPI003AFF7CD8